MCDVLLALAKTIVVSVLLAIVALLLFLLAASVPVGVYQVVTSETAVENIIGWGLICTGGIMWAIFYRDIFR